MEMDRIVRELEEAHITGLSRTTRWRLEKEGRFPKSIPLGANSRGRLLSELLEWLKERAAARHNKAD